MTAPGATSFPRSKIRILLLEGVHATAVERLTAAGYDVESRPGALDEATLCEAIDGVHVLGIRSRTRLTAPVLAAGRRLLSVGCFCIGTSQVDLAAANAAGVPVFNAPLSNTRSVAELILAELIMLSRRLGDANGELHRGQWRKQAGGRHELRGRTLGIVGYGHIGRQVGVLAEAFGMTVLFHDVIEQLPMGNNRRVTSLAELLPAADFVTLHVPETPHTRGLIGAAELALMRRGACLLNASRGSVVDLHALAAALRAGQLSGAAVDVYPEEPERDTPDFDCPLRGLPNVVLTPHIGGSTEEAQQSIGQEVADKLVRFVDAGGTHGAVNFPNLDLPHKAGTHRILNVHRNVPGVLAAINGAASALGANVHAQVLATDPATGYLIMDLDQDVSHDLQAALAAQPGSIRTRILY